VVSAAISSNVKYFNHLTSYHLRLTIPTHMLVNVAIAENANSVFRSLKFKEKNMRRVISGRQTAYVLASCLVTSLVIGVSGAVAQGTSPAPTTPTTTTETKPHHHHHCPGGRMKKWCGKRFHHHKKTGATGTTPAATPAPATPAQ
jgi:hypothetical protein